MHTASYAAFAIFTWIRCAFITVAPPTRITTDKRKNAASQVIGNHLFLPYRNVLLTNTPMTIAIMR